MRLLCCIPPQRLILSICARATNVILQLETNRNYGDKCTEDENEQGVVCSEQTSSLLTVGLVMVTTQLLSPVLGYLLDRVGPKRFSFAMACLGMIGMAIGCIAIGLLVDLLLFVTFPLLSITSWMGSLLIVQLGFYFQGQTASRVIFTLNTLFDAGALSYWFLWLVQDVTGTDTLNIWLGYMIFSGCIYSGLVYFWRVAKQEPNHVDVSFVSTRFSHHESLHFREDFDERMRNSYSAKLSESLSQVFVAPLETRTVRRVETDSLDVGTSENKTENPRAPVLSTYKIVAERQPFFQLTSSPFLLLCLFFGLHCASTNWNLSTQRDFLAYLGDDDQDNLYLSIFSLLTPVSILGVPFIDYAILNFGWTGAFHGTNLLGLIYMLIKVVSSDLNVQIIGFVVFSFYRSFLFGICFSFLPGLVSPPVIGRAAGIMFAIAGGTSFLTIPLARLAINTYDGDFFIPNLIFLCFTVPCSLAVVGLGIYLGKEKDAKEQKVLRLSLAP